MKRTSEQTRDASVVETATGSSPGPSDAAEPVLEIGAVIATRYRLVRLIARGGMGEVYEAEDLELGARIAIKTIRSERIDDPRAAARLKQEILAARKITHPNVVRLFDVGFHVLDDQRELAFFTMALLDGETLDAHIHRDGKLALPDALAFARQMAAALDAAHDAGVTHRDFKSQNVIVVGERAIVTDFGLARDHLDGTGAATSEFVGTPAYMAPEQVNRAHPIGPAADIYAFGVVLYEMVTGEWPFRRDSALATAAARIEHDAPSPRLLAPDLPTAWDAAILRCLRRDPGERFARAGDVVAALEGPRPRRWRAWGIGALVAAAIGGGALLVAMKQSSIAPSRCEPPAGGELFVDAAATPGGTGSRACPVRTITAALAIDTNGPRVIHVAAGFYDKALGEQFPLEVRGAVSIVGAGIDRTTISGTGAWDGRPSAGTLATGTWQTTLVVGDATRKIEIADLSLAPGVSRVQHDVLGIACTRGAASEPNTVIRRVGIGMFGTSLVVGTEVAPTATGCNLELADSRLHDGTSGIWVVGCGNGEGRVATNLRVRRTRFQAFHNDASYPGSGIRVWDCARTVDIEDSMFADSDAGITVIRHDGELAGSVAVRNSELKLLGRVGIQLTLAVSADLRNNTFGEISGRGENLGRAPALLLSTDGVNGPSVVLRENSFVENDLAIEIAGTGPIPANLRVDAGRTGDPGHNVFFCNSAPPTSSVIGGDIAIRIPSSATTRFDLAGNTWDHAPPTIASRASNGVDILTTVTAPMIDTSGAEPHESGCMARSP